MHEAQAQEHEKAESHQPTATDVAAVWGIELTAVHCAHCGEAHLVPERTLGGSAESAALPRCPVCLRGPVARQPAYLRPEPPEQVLPYAITEQKLAYLLERWARGIRFRPADLRPGALAQRAWRYFVPLWLVDGRVEGTWRADVGFDYQVVSYQDRYSDGMGWDSQAVKESRVRWEPRLGRINRSYENLPVPALEDHHPLMNRLGDFDLNRRDDYTADAVTGGAVRIPTLDPQAAWPEAEAAFVRAAGSECLQAAGADHIRDFTLDAEYRDLNWTLLLLPTYVTWYREGEQLWPVLVNGQSGRVSGVRRASRRKATITSLILGGMAVLLFLIGGVLALLGMVLPPAPILGGVFLLLALLLALAAPVPVISVWIFNRRSAPDDRLSQLSQPAC